MLRTMVLELLAPTTVLKVKALMEMEVRAPNDGARGGGEDDDDDDHNKSGKIRFRNQNLSFERF